MEPLTFTQVCKCTDTTKYDDLCPMCLSECLEYLNQVEDMSEFENYEHS